MAWFVVRRWRRVALLLLCHIFRSIMAEDPLPQTATGHYLIPLQLALYDPSDAWSVADTAPSQSAAITHIVTAALQTAVFCPLRIILVNDENQNVCPDASNATFPDAVVVNATTTSANTPSILDAAPYAVDVVPVQDGPYQWTVWTLQYTLLQVGDVYIAEALQNADHNLDIATLAPAAAQSMRAVLQLTLDVNGMDGTLDALLQQPPNTTTLLRKDVYCSPVQEARNKCATIAAQYASSFQPRTWYPMRVAGIVLWVLTALAMVGLPHLAARRRRRKMAAP
jgi:hypothetical protein